MMAKNRVEVEYNDLAAGRSAEEEKRYATNNVALIVFLEMISEEKSLCIANTHIWWNTKSADVQLAQTQCVLKAIQEQQMEGVPVVLCGM